MRISLYSATLLILLGHSLAFEIVHNGISGKGRTTRYWDCCKPSCAWKDNVNNGLPARSCERNGISPVDVNTKSACEWNGLAYTCNNQVPYKINKTLAYGFGGASFTGGIDTRKCCSCFLLKFDGVLTGKQMVLQVTNTGSDLGYNQFNIALPGEGFGAFTTGCTRQWGIPANVWGAQYGGVNSVEKCKWLPTALQSGCRFRFTWFKNADNPSVYFHEVKCPTEITRISNCIRY